jgi:CBS domain containing-hemolysin-like protein
MMGILIILLGSLLFAFLITLAAFSLFFRLNSRIKSWKKHYMGMAISKDDFGNYVNQGIQSDEKRGDDHQNFQIIQNALDFSHVRLRECMVPRTEIEAIECASSLEDLRQKFIGTQHSRILVYHKSIDNIIGYFELKEIFKSQPDIRSGVRKLAIVPETMAASKLLKVFVEEKKSIALVVDEFGGTSGIVTIEDLLEEIVGDIEDEHDTSELIERVLGNNEYIFSGRLEIDYLNEKYNLGLPEEDDYETLAGMILFFHGSIPGNNDVIRVRNLVFKVLKVTSTRVELVNLKIG